MASSSSSSFQVTSSNTSDVTIPLATIPRSRVWRRRRAVSPGLMSLVLLPTDHWE